MQTNFAFLRKAGFLAGSKGWRWVSIHNQVSLPLRKSWRLKSVPWAWIVCIWSLAQIKLYPYRPRHPDQLSLAQVIYYNRCFILVGVEILVLHFAYELSHRGLCWFSSTGTENTEVNQEYQNSSQESWVQRMLMALVGDSALFNTREGRAGKVHNFMLGLNLNSCYPLSPLADLLSQESVEEDELDAAVAG